MNLNLLLLSSSVKGKAMAFAIMFLMGIGTLSAQYTDRNDALVLIKGEVTVLLDQEANTTNPGELSTIRFKKNYYMAVFQKIDDGIAVQQAIHSDLPTGKPTATGSELAVTAGPNFKVELAALVAEAEALLSE